MEIQELLAQTREGLSQRVFGEPYEKDGVTVIPVASVRGGGGGGGGSAPDGQSQGSGGGYGLTARPVGAFILKDGAVSWQPAVDLNRAILGGQVVVVVALLVVRSMIKARAKRRRRK